MRRTCTSPTMALLLLSVGAAAQNSTGSTPPPPPPSGGGGISVGVLVGILVGVLVFIILKTACIIYICNRRRQRAKDPRRGSRILAGAKKPLKDGAAGLEDWEMDVSDVEILRYEDGTEVELGSGGFGRVLHGIRAGVQDVAIKTVVQSDIKAEADFLREINMLKFVSRDRNIVQFYGACRRNNQLWLVTEFMEGGDLRQALTTRSKERVTWWRQGKRIALDVARGLAFLHANNVIHRDLKSKNVLLTQDGLAKIGDVGMAKVMSEGTMTQDAVVGTFAWASPELLLGERCTEKVDVYSLGVVLWEVCTGELPVRGAIETPAHEECPREVVAVIADCMKRDPALRPSALEVYQRLLTCEPLEVKPSILETDDCQVGELPYTIRAAVADDSATAFSQLRASLKLAGRCNDSARDDSARAESIASGRDSPNSRRTSLGSGTGVPVIQEAPAGEGEDSCEELSIDADELREHVETSDASSGGDSLFRSPNVHTLHYTAGNDDNV